MASELVSVRRVKLNGSTNRPRYTGCILPQRLRANRPCVIHDEIVTRAGITLSDGSTPTATHFRRFWYKAYNEALSHYLDRIDGFSDD